jgi:hypothetical protein
MSARCLHATPQMKGGTRASGLRRPCRRA